MPPEMFVACPLEKRRGGIVNVEKVCTACKHHGGILVLNPHPELAFVAAHSIACALPRQLGMMQVIEPETPPDDG